MPAGGEGMKAELPTNEGWAAELPAPMTGSPQEQTPWSNLNPQAPPPSYRPGAPYAGAGMAELPAGRTFAPNGQYQELSG